jgi:hypothetical protein
MVAFEKLSDALTELGNIYYSLEDYLDFTSCPMLFWKTS